MTFKTLHGVQACIQDDVHGLVFETRFDVPQKLKHVFSLPAFG